MADLIVPILAVRRGTVITCPGCGLEQSEVVKDLFKDQILTPAYIRGIKQSWYLGEKAICKKCGMPWYFNGKLHTKKGWVP